MEFIAGFALGLAFPVLVKVARHSLDQRKRLGRGGF